MFLELIEKQSKKKHDFKSAHMTYNSSTVARMKQESNTTKRSNWTKSDGRDSLHQKIKQSIHTPLQILYNAKISYSSEIYT